MSNEKFKVKFGLSVGEDNLTVDASTGNIITAGDLAVNGGDITTTATTANIFNNNVTTLNIGDSVTGDLTLGRNAAGRVYVKSNLFETQLDALVNANLEVKGTTTLGNNTADSIIVNGLVSGNITFSDNSTTTNRGVTGTVGTSDYWKYGGGSTASDAGYAEIATGDNGTEPIYVRQYNGASVTNSLTLLDATGNTTLPGNLTVGGNLTVNGTTTTLNTETLLVEDNIVTLNSNVTGTPSTNAGIEIERGDAVNSALIWNESTDKWEQNRAGTSTIIAANTDELNEGTTNKYFANSLARQAISVSDSGGDGSLSYDNSTGVITYTGPSATEVRAHFSGGTGVTITSGVVAIGQSVGTGDSPSFAGVTGGNLSLGVSTDNTIASTDTNGNITLAPNGTGDIIATFSNGGNLTNNRNFVHGAIRNSTTESIGDIWAVNSTGPNNPFRGVSLDNSGDTTRGPGTVLRSYSGGAVSGSGTRGRLIFEKARGTAASPTAVQVGDFLGSIDATGYTSTGWVNDNVASLVPAFFGFNASENWVSNTNLGTAFTLSMTPTATTITSSANLISVLQLAPESNVIRGDRMAISQGKTAAFTATGCSTSGNTLTIGTLTSGTIVPGQVIASTGLLNGFYIVSNVSGSGSGSQWILSGNPGTTSGQAVTANAGMIGSNPNVSATIDALQDLRLIKNTIKSQGGVTQITTSFSGNTLALAGDQINLQTASATSLVGNKINYNRVYGQWQYDATITPAAANTAYAYPIAGASSVTDMANIASVGSTSRIIPGALGQYKLQFSVQIDNADTGQDHTAYFWWRKNGTDVPNSMGRIHVAKAQETIGGWDNMIDVTTITDYWELMYAVDDTNVTLPYYAATAFGPGTASMFITLVPIGA